MIQNKLFHDCLAAVMHQLKRYSMQRLEAKNAYKYHINIVVTTQHPYRKLLVNKA